ncbi:hypothetical protein BJ508DRAFT_378921 [Ascobolus immersus RN42]|uniref:Cyanovirin-N domain-containing protein n=1 Tax=Ascobolus immersus RN42 TaxID=1160509 RepID=A0A3N4HUA2_ASCIM|nr:hypothetical protein BJ508DRAFT_378921 [Ascobolus immersus RN42]
MKFTISAIFVTILSTASLLIDTVSAGGFAASCDLSKSRLTGEGDTRRFNAVCKRKDGSYAPESPVYISSCFRNNNGNLVAQFNGGAMGSCSGTSLQNGKILKANCRSKTGASVSNSIDLNQFITNANGIILCDVYLTGGRMAAAENAALVEALESASIDVSASVDNSTSTVNSTSVADSPSVADSALVADSPSVENTVLAKRYVSLRN